MKDFTREEKIEILRNYLDLAKQGKRHEALKIIQQIPLAPHLAKAVKEVCGNEFIEKSGFDLSAAEAQYGKNWLAQ